MSENELTGPDLTKGVELSSIDPDTPLLGHAAGEAVLIARRGDEVYAVGATCSHYSGPLAEGLLVGTTVRCPWHHACFDLRTGEALHAPALNPIPCWQVEQREGKVRVLHKLDEPRPGAAPGGAPQRIVIVGGGAAGNAAAEMLRREGHAGSITMLSADESVPVDRPNLSKSYLAGSAPEDWIPLRPLEFYREHGIDLRLGVQVTALDTAQREVVLADGSRIGYDALLLATGGEPVHLDLPGAGLPHVHYLRTLADSRALIARVEASRSAVVIGGSFIGLEVAASLRARGVEVHVVAPEAVPMERVLGPEIGALVRRTHEQHGVRFHLGTTAAEIAPQRVVLKNGDAIDADLVVIGVGVRPAIALAQQAGLAVDRGVLVDETLQTSAAGIYAAGDIARWPDAASGERIRIEHWVVAERQGQTAARNMLGRRERFDAVPFFWTEQYDLTVAYVGHAERWDEIRIDGDVDARDCRLAYVRGGKTLAVATIGRDRESLLAELELERKP